MPFFRNPNQTIGLDISDHIVRAVLLVNNHKIKQIKHFTQIPLNEGIINDGHIEDVTAFQKTVKKLMTKGIHAKTATAVVGLPESHGFVKTIYQENPEAIKEEIQKHLPFPYEEMAIDTVVKNGLLSFVAVKKDVIEQYLSALLPLGFHIRALEIESQAIARLFAGKKIVSKNPNQAIIIGDIGHNHTTFVLVRNGLIEFTHTSKLISGKNLTEHLKQHFAIDYQEAEKIKLTQQDNPEVQKIIDAHLTALANELKRVVNFHQEHPIGQVSNQYFVYIIGGSAKLKNLRQHLEAKIQYPVHQAQLSTEIIVPKKLQPQFLSYGTAIGLAIRDFNP